MTEKNFKNAANTLAATVKRLREDRGLSQDDLAERCGVKRSSIDSIERGTSSNPAAQLVAELAVGLDVPMGELLKAQGLPERYIPKGVIEKRETHEMILERLRLAAPICIPVYVDHPFRARKMGVEPNDYIFRARLTGEAIKTIIIEAYYAPARQFEPEIKQGDILLVNPEACVEDGDIVACLWNDKLTIGRAHKTGDECWLENNEYKKIEINKCEEVGRIIEVRRIY